jgi:hypothetical protein
VEKVVNVIYKCGSIMELRQSGMFWSHRWVMKCQGTVTEGSENLRKQIKERKE